MTPYDQGYAAARPNQARYVPANPFPPGTREALGFEDGVKACERAWQRDNDRERMQSKHGRW